MTTWAPDTRQLNIGEIAGRIQTNRLFRRESGLTFAGKNGRDRLDQPRSTCHICQAPIRFDGIVWIDMSERNKDRAYRCYSRQAATGNVRRPHEPAELAQKHLARARILDFICQRFEGRIFSMLTLPGVQWAFEHELLRRRFRGRRKAAKAANAVQLYAAESVDAIYRASLGLMPSRHSGLITSTPPDWATFQVATESVSAFWRGDVLQAIPTLQLDAAWLDFTGPLTPHSVRVLEEAWRTRRIREVLVITSLKARWPAPLGSVIAEAGGLTSWLESVFKREATEHLEYAEEAAMHQVIFARQVFWLPGDPK